MLHNQHPDFTRRELQILELLAQGYRNKEIAIQLNLGVRTVESHLEDIYKCLKVSSRSGAVAKALTLGLIKLEEEEIA